MDDPCASRTPSSCAFSGSRHFMSKAAICQRQQQVGYLHNCGKKEIRGKMLPVSYRLKWVMVFYIRGNCKSIYLGASRGNGSCSTSCRTGEVISQPSCTDAHIAPHAQIELQWARTLQWRVVESAYFLSE